MNRGLARRTLFEHEPDFRFFLSRLARAVHARQLEVHAYCLLSTHFHLLLRSLSGNLAAAMRAIQNEYSRWFNRRRRRDGPLFRGRYRSRRVGPLEYRKALVRYIDLNPVSAGIVSNPVHYPHGSARHHARRRGPPWLERSWVHSIEPGPLSPGLARVLERRIELTDQGVDPLDDLIGAAPERILAWMRSKALLADGTRVGLPVCDPGDIIAWLGAARSSLLHDPGRLSLMEVGLLRELGACSWQDAGAHLQMSKQAVSAAHQRHLGLLLLEEEYSITFARFAALAIQKTYS
jgi:REP element-mobilizing transposase RayT